MLIDERKHLINENWQANADPRAMLRRNDSADPRSSSGMVEKERQRLEVLKRRQEKELQQEKEQQQERQQQVQYEVTRKVSRAAWRVCVCVCVCVCVLDTTGRKATYYMEETAKYSDPDFHLLTAPPVACFLTHMLLCPAHCCCTPKT